jgi:NAD(P)-dependent dehydrogenase (short-subunit alcohol dehydrogenase family)
MDLHLTGKRAVVTGASKGIGLAVAQGLAGEGVRVVAGARGFTDSLRQLAEGAPAHPVSVDLSTAEGPQRLVNEAVSALAV